MITVGLRVVGNQTNRLVHNESSVAELTCEMTLYLRPDEDLQWFKDGELINGTERHTISYSYGSGQGQSGGRTTGPSRLTTLNISEPQLADSGIYTCAIRDTDQSEDIQITIVQGKRKYSVVTQPFQSTCFRSGAIDL